MTTWADAHEVGHDVMTHVIDAMRLALRPELARFFVVTGEPPVDAPCGQFTVEVVRTYRTDPFPIESPAFPRRLAELTVDCVCLLTRCDAPPTATGRAVAATDKDTAHRDLLRDAAIVFTALSNLPAPMRSANVAQDFGVSEGSTLSVSSSVSVGLPQVDWC